MMNISGNWRRQIASTLLDERERRGWTQEEMGQRVGLPAMTISHYETGHRTPGLGNLIKLSEALCLSLDFFVAERGAA